MLSRQELQQMMSKADYLVKRCMVGTKLDQEMQYRSGARLRALDHKC